MASGTQIDLIGIEEQLAELQSERWFRSPGVEAVMEKLRALQGDEKAAATPSGQAFRKIVELTKAMFPSGVEVDVDCDPSDPEPPFVNLIVRVAGEPSELIAMEREWIDRALPLNLSHFDRPRLLIYPQNER